VCYNSVPDIIFKLLDREWILSVKIGEDVPTFSSHQYTFTQNLLKYSYIVKSQNFQIEFDNKKPASISNRGNFEQGE
jgi:hypothetical protein